MLINLLTDYVRIILVAAMSATALIAGASRCVVNVTALYGQSGEKLEFAAVTLSSDNVTVSGLTGADGCFSARVEPGQFTVRVSYVGYRPCQTSLNVNGDTCVTARLKPLDLLDEVTVTARESRFASSASIIDTTAMKHLQPSSFTDLLELLPGGVSVDPDMGKVNMINLRQARNMSEDDNYATASLGTSFVIDGVPVNTNAELLATGDPGQSQRVSAGKGVDMRVISADEIERVEIVRGIASVEYGELTSGLVKIERKSGISALEARFKADTQSRLFYLGKGLKMPGNDWIVNLSADLLDSKIDIRNNRENFKRINGSVRSNKKWNNPVVSVTWNSSVNCAAKFERDKNDPDLTVNNTIDYYTGDTRSISWNNSLTVRKVTESLFQSATLTTGVSYTDGCVRQQKHVATSRVMPVPVSLSPGSSYVGYLPMLYLADARFENRPLTAHVKAAARLKVRFGSVINKINAGFEWNMSKNYGAGAVYDLTRPLTAGNTTRPRPYSDIPAMHQLSGYVEENMKLFAGAHTLSLIAGVRTSSLVHLDRAYHLAGKVYLDPRVNLTWILPAVYVGRWPATIELTAGSGQHTKMPVAAYLYPDRLYTDFEQLNYFHDNAAYRTMNVMTFVDDMTNYDLRAARNTKRELRGDITYRDNRLSVTCFRELMTDGFRHTGFVSRYVYNRYDASSFDAVAAGRAPTVEELPSTQAVSQMVHSKITNGSTTEKQGIEFAFQSRRFKSAGTRLTVSGAFFKTVNRNSQPLWYKPSVVINNRELQYVALYDDIDGAEYTSFNTNFMSDTEVPSLGLNFSLSVQNMWFTSRRTLRRDGVPVSYLDSDGNLHDFEESDMTDAALSQLVRHFSESSFEKMTVPLSVTFNLKATKQFMNNRIGIALYVNRLFTIQPDYERYGVTMRRYSSPYFGMEINFKI